MEQDKSMPQKTPDGALGSQGLYDQWHKAVASRELVDKADNPWQRLVKLHLKSVKGKSVLEIGCGRGGFSKYLLKKGARLTAADYSESAVAITKQLLGDSPHLETIVADVQDIPFPDQHFDLVISLETLEHIPNPDQGLAELVRVTKIGGRIIITTPNYFGLLGLYRSYRERTGRPWTEEGQPINQPLKLKDRVNALKQLGCEIEIIDGVGHYLPVPKHPMKVRILDVPPFRSTFKWFAAHSLTIARRSKL